MVVLAFLLLFGSHSVFAQSDIGPGAVRLRDTVGISPNPDNMQRKLRFLNFTTCMNHDNNPFRIELLIERPGVLDGTDSTWGSGNVDWTFPAGRAWTVSGRRGASGGAGWDTVILQVPYRFLFDIDQVFGGEFRAVWNNVGTGAPQFSVSVDIPLRSAISMADSIFVDLPLCQGIDAKFWIAPKNPGADPYFDRFTSEMNIRWVVLGTNNQPIPGMSKAVDYGSDTTFIIPAFNPAIHRAVRVQRNLCPLGSLADEAERTLRLDGDRSISNPPLDTTTIPREDMLHRIAWIGDVEPRWTPVPMIDPVCVNYGQMPDADPAGFRSTRDDGTQVTGGYLFFQVGTKVDTMVRYIWEYDNELLERVFVGHPTEGGTNWSALGGTRWSSLLNDPEVDELTAANAGWFGRPGADSTHRAAFRVRALNPGDPGFEKRRDSIRISVHPICSHCVNPNGTPFQNRLLTGNIGRAWDTVKPMNDFLIELTSPFAGDTVCVGSSLNFRAEPNVGVVDWWNRTGLDTMFNINGFGTYFMPEWADGNVNANFVGNTHVDVTGSAEGFINPLSAAGDIQPRWVTVTPNNSCFVRVSPTVNLVGGVHELAPQAQPWHQLLPFRVKRLARAPLIIDPSTGNVLGPSDTIYICRYQVMDSLGDGHRLGPDGQPVRGVNYILAMGSGTNLVNANLVKNPENVMFRITPASSFHGFFNPNGEEGNPAGMGWSFDDYMTDDPLQRTRMWIWPGGYTGSDEGEFRFAAQDMCGRGDTLIVPFIIIDTISPDPTVLWTETLHGNTQRIEALEDATPCEATTMFFRIRERENPIRGTTTQWWFPDSWRGIEGTFNDPEPLRQLTLTFGKEPGTISVNMFNRHCGGSRRIESPLIVPIPYYRVEGNWANVHYDVCQDSVYVFALNREPIGTMHDLLIQFPNNWNIMGNIENHNINPPKGNRDTIPRNSLDLLTYDNVFFRTLVNDSIGNFGDILVRWLVLACDTGANARPVFWDTTRIFTHTYPLAPLPNGVWPDTVCLRDTIWLSVVPAPKDTIQDNHYVWTFPGAPGEWRVIYSSANSDSVRVIVGFVDEVDTIRVRAMSSRCSDPMSEFRTESASILKMPIMIWDTAVFEMDLILDAMRGDERFGEKLCAGDEIQLFVNKPYSVDSIDWRWGASPGTVAHNVPPDPNMQIFDWWEFTDKTVLPDTLAITLAQNSTTRLFIQVNMRNKCGWSQSPVIPLEMADVISATLSQSWVHFDAVLCAGEAGFYSIDSVPHADRYVWHFPWEPFTDTVYMNSSRTMTPTATGNVWVVAMNNCSESLPSEIRQITEIIPAPKAPVAVNFGRRMQDGWLLDTVCLRRQYNGWRVALDPTDGDFSTDYPAQWQEFQWMLLGGDTLNGISDFFGFTTLGRNEFNVRNLETNERRYNTQIGVTALREGCTAPGDTLKIWLTSVDTIPLERLGLIIPELEPTNPNPCPGSVVRFRVQRDSAFAYRWILPDTTYRFLSSNPLDHVRNFVDIVIGQNPSQIGVLTTTGPTFDLETNYCPYENMDTLWSVLIEPFPAPTLDYFSEFPNDTVCEGEWITLAVQTGSGTPQSYRWVFPAGWTVAADTITSTNSISLMAGRNGGTIQVFAREMCDGIYLNEGEPIDSTIHVFGMPHIHVVGDSFPCPGLEYPYILVPSDSWVNFTPNVVATHPSVIVTNNNPVYDVLFGGGGTGVRFEFTNISHGRCANLLPSDYSRTITAFNAPQLFLFLNGRGTGAIRTDTVCRNVEYTYVAREPNGSVSEFIWNIPPEWETHATITGDLSDTLRITFNDLLSDNANFGIIELLGRTHCHIDTAAYRQPILLDTIPLPSPILDARNNDQPFFQRACESDTIVLFVRNNPRYDTVFWQWNGGNIIQEDNDEIVNGWRFLDTNQAKRGDTLALIVPTGITNTLNIAIGVRNQCGVIRIYDYTLTPSEPITQKPTFATAPTEVCFGESTTFILNPIANAETFYWNFSWTPVVDSIHNSVEHSFVPQSGDIWVIPANGCGAGQPSDPVTIDQVFPRPNRAVPVNFAFDEIAEVGRDTFCLRRSKTLTVEKNSADELVNINRFEWFYMSGDSITPLSGTGTDFTIDADLATTLIGKRTTIGVAAIRDGCNERGDTLQIELIMVDTVPLRWLGAIIVSPDPTSGLFCPMDTIRLSVNDVVPVYLFAPPSYLWTSSEPTWQIISDTSLHEITVVVGENQSIFSVVALTGFCDYPSEPVESEIFEIRPRPVLEGFTAFPTAGLCAETEDEISVSLTPESMPADGFRFTLYQRIARTTTIDTLVVVQPGSTFRFTPPDWDFDSITVVVEAIDSSC